MSTFFHGWRRKVGSVALVMAIAEWAGLAQHQFLKPELVTTEAALLTLLSACLILWKPKPKERPHA